MDGENFGKEGTRMEEIEAVLRAQQLLKQGKGREAAMILEQHGLGFHQFFEILRELQDGRSLRKLKKILEEGELYV